MSTHLLPATILVLSLLSNSIVASPLRLSWLNRPFIARSWTTSNSTAIGTGTGTGIRPPWFPNSTVYPIGTSTGIQSVPIITATAFSTGTAYGTGTGTGTGILSYPTGTGTPTYPNSTSSHYREQPSATPVSIMPVPTIIASQSTHNGALPTSVASPSALAPSASSPRAPPPVTTFLIPTTTTVPSVPMISTDSNVSFVTVTVTVTDFLPTTVGVAVSESPTTTAHKHSPKSTYGIAPLPNPTTTFS
ncbi:MAG: hypothetical protein MMC33_008025, partial [Icmadophila ericetorum]|nr:hypothetical protein [Icmadophila ericetorum]